MTIYNLHLPAETALRCKLLLDDVLPHARTEGRECSFLLSVASMVLCQTNDKIHKAQYSTRATRVDKDGFKAALKVTLSSARHESGSHLNLFSPSANWAADRKITSAAEMLARGPEERLLASTNADRIGADWTTGAFFKHLRNGLAHGSVWWGPEPKRRRTGDFHDQVSEDIGLVFVMSIRDAKTCPECGAMDVDALSDDRTEWQATRFTVTTFEACIRYWCDLLIRHKIPPSEAVSLLEAA